MRISTWITGSQEKRQALKLIGERLVLVEEDDTPSDVAQWLSLHTDMPDMGIEHIQNTWAVAPSPGFYIILPIARNRQGILLWPYPPREQSESSSDVQ